MDQIIEMDDNSNFQIFRHATKKKVDFNTQFTVFIVSFKFLHLSHKANKLTSIVPMLLITGFPGFVKKIYAVNYKNGYWQGMYQWKSLENLEEYKRSFVFKMMNKRAIQESIKSIHYENKSLDTFIKEKVKYNNEHITPYLKISNQKLYEISCKDLSKYLSLL
ncbi:hypothetical protein [Draconibacterium sediminis]|uniref:Uncharacterized protein n=1 Tax=Draconibacterium sediminis TaxID=1544798 RepID=A0A0D8JE58_9BACT|nr:hypothetical protein [Draconibacterium sediminis]KJF44138.1 hypothetical protein LH29_00985 [Draconibacterium sediminis]